MAPRPDLLRYESARQGATLVGEGSGQPSARAPAAAARRMLRARVGISESLQGPTSAAGVTSVTSPGGPACPPNDQARTCGARRGAQRSGRHRALAAAIVVCGACGIRSRVTLRNRRVRKENRRSRAAKVPGLVGMHPSAQRIRQNCLTGETLRTHRAIGDHGPTVAMKRWALPRPSGTILVTWSPALAS